jgi:hypothetical protein
MVFNALLASFLVLVFANTVAAQPQPNCQGYFAWLAIMDKELAGLKARTMEHLMPRAVNLFRDEYFVPFFGKPYEKTAPEERREFYFAIRNGCPAAPGTPERKLFVDWDVVVQGAFVRPTTDIVAGLAERQALITRMKNLKEAKREPTREAFQTLQRDLAAAKTELVKLWPREEAAIAADLVSVQAALETASPEGNRIATIVNAEAGVEGSQSGGPPTKNDFVYIDAVIAKGGEGNLESLPVEHVFQWLYDSKFKCLSTTFAAWSAGEGTARATQFGTKRFVIDCRGNCRGLRYRVSGRADAQPWHYGLSQPVPVINMKSNGLGTNDFSFVFTRANAVGPSPTVRVHAWSSQFGDYGPGCKVD